MKQAQGANYTYITYHPQQEGAFSGIEDVASEASEWEEAVGWITELFVY